MEIDKKDEVGYQKVFPKIQQFARKHNEKGVV